MNLEDEATEQPLRALSLSALILLSLSHDDSEESESEEDINRRSGVFPHIS
jgi:hypothetical protein